MEDISQNNIILILISKHSLFMPHVYAIKINKQKKRTE